MQGANQALLDAQALGNSIINRDLYLRRERQRQIKSIRQSIRQSQSQSQSQSMEEADLALGSPLQIQMPPGPSEGWVGGGVASLSASSAAPMWKMFAAYEKQMIPRAAKKVLKSRTAARVLHDTVVLMPGNVTRASVAEQGGAGAGAGAATTV
jgi:hypothetical protein